MDRDVVARFDTSAVPWFDFVGLEVIVAADWGLGSVFSILGALRVGGGDIEALRLRAKRSSSIALRSRPSIELNCLGGGSTFSGADRGGVLPSVVLASSLLGSVICFGIEGGA